MKQLMSLMKIELILAKRQATYYLLSIGMPTAFYLLFSGIYSNIPSNFLRDYLLSMTAFSMMSTAFFSLPSTLHTDKISNWQKTIVHSPVSMVEYYISKFLAMMIDYLLAIIVVFSVGHIVRHVNMPIMDWFVSAGMLMIGSAAFVVLGLLLALIPNTQLVSVIGNIVYMALAILGGLWFPLTMFPSWMQAIGKTLPTYQLMNLISVYLNQHRLAWGSVLYLVAFTLCVGGLILWIKKRIEVK